MFFIFDNSKYNYMGENQKAITADKNDNLDSIVEKIISGKDEKAIIGIYSMFKITHPHYTTAVNIYLKTKNPEVWGPIRKVYYPTFLDKIKKSFGK